MPIDKTDWRRLTVLHKAIINNIRTLVDAVSNTSKAAVDAIAENTKAAKQAAEKEPPQPPGRVAVDIQIPREETNRYYSEHNKTHRLQWWTVWISVATFLAVAAYAVLTLKQWQTAEKTLSAAMQQSEIANRPWVVSIQATMADYLQPDGEFDSLGFDQYGMYAVVKLCMKNVGHSPAINVTTVAELFFPEYSADNSEPLVKEQERMCHQILDAKGPVSIVQGEIGAPIQWSLRATDRVASESNRKQGYLLPAVVVCTAYAPIYAPEQLHFTGVSYMIRRKFHWLILGERVPADLLSLEPAQTRTTFMSRDNKTSNKAHQE
jgi:hypothetical protein